MNTRVARRLLILSALLACGIVAGAGVPLTNPGFEMRDKTGWEIHGEGWEASDDPADVYEGAYGIVNTIETNASEGWRVIMQAVPAEPGKRYNASLRIRARDANDVMCYLEIQYLDDGWNVVGQFQSEHLFGSYPFTLAVIEGAMAPPGTAMMGLRGAVFVPAIPRKKTASISMDSFELSEQP